MLRRLEGRMIGIRRPFAELRETVMGAAGPAILFVCLLAASIMVGVCVLAYAARCALVIVEETAQGQDEIVWSSEPYVDWLGHAVQFLELVGIWLVPSALAARLLRNVWLPEDGALRVLILAGPGLWLFFPIGLLSSLSAQSRWVPFRWAILARFLRVAPSAVIFYFLTVLVLAIGVVPWYDTLFGGKGHLLPVAAAASVAALFIYARLLGRLAWIIQRLPAMERKPVKAKTPKRPSSVKPRTKKKKAKPEVHDPWAVSEEEIERRKLERFPWAKDTPKKTKPGGYQVPSAEEIEGYSFASDKPVEPEAPPKSPPRSPLAMPPEEDEPINVQDTSEPEAPPPPQETQSELFAEQVRQRLAERTRVQPLLPAHPFFSGVFNFPFYGVCLPNGLALFLAFLVLGGLVSQLMQIGQQLFGW